MKFVEPGIEYWPQAEGLAGMWSQIARVTRLSYDSKPREDETDEEFVERVILKPARNKDGSYNILRLHGEVLEFGTIYITIPEDDLLAVTDRDNGKDIKELLHNDFINRNHLFEDNNIFYYAITTNLRFLIEHNLLDTFKKYVVDKPLEVHDKTYSFHVITDIGVSREWNRHESSMSANEESTRHVDYTKDSHGRCITYTRPTWISKEICQQIEESLNSDEDLYDMEDKDYYPWLASLVGCETMYFNLRKKGWRPEQARLVLPLNTKTEVAYCAYEDAWRHFLKLRSSHAVSGKPHPNISSLADTLEEVLNELTEKQ